MFALVDSLMLAHDYNYGEKLIVEMQKNLAIGKRDTVNLLVEQIYSTVKWRESLDNIYQSGVNNFIEIGPGKALTGMVKRTLKEAKTFSINKITDIELCNNELKK